MNYCFNNNIIIKKIIFNDKILFKNLCNFWEKKEYSWIKL